jgi:cysteine desulfurase family protein (TIGR01976 family)
MTQIKLTPARLAQIRDQFPALARTVNEQPAVFFDGPAGSQVPRRVIDAVADYYSRCNANSHGRFTTARESDALLERAGEVLGEFVGGDPRGIVWGANMTTITLAMSRTLAQSWQPGDEIIVTRLDHDANVTPWVIAAERAGVIVRRVNINIEDCTLDLDHYRSLLTPRTKLVAIGCASNCVGTINPVAEMTRLAHEFGALVWLDAVHYAPHLLPDVTAWDCDFLVCSAYKFFGPHLGILWGKPVLLESLRPDKLRPSPNDLPGRFMTGTQAHELIAGTMAAVEYLSELGRNWSAEAVTALGALPRILSLRESLLVAYDSIARYEQELCAELLRGLSNLPCIRVYGITDPRRVAERTATVSFTHRRLTPLGLAEYLDLHGIFSWHGNFYALPLTETLGLEPAGLLRVGLLHYNTSEEVARLLKALADLEV